MIDLAGNVVVVTGAAAGLGRGAALALAAAGAAAALIDIDEPGLQAVAEAIGNRGGRAEIFSANVAVSASITETFDRVAALWPEGIDSVVNVVGVEFYKDFDDVTETDWDRQLAVNLKSAFLCAQAGVKLMERRGGGSIVNTASVQALASTGRTTPYAAAKAGVIAMSRDMARDLGPRGIRVNTICPGCIHSPMLDRSYQSEETRVAGLATLASVLPLRRIGEPADFGNLVNFLVSPMASYITGQAIALDGGMMCRLPLA